MNTGAFLAKKDVKGNMLLGIRCISLLIMVSISVTSWAERLPFEDACPLYVGARALGMGNAFTAIADDATAGFWNPAGLIQWQGVKVFGANKFYNREDYAFDPKGIGYSYRGNAFFWGNKIALGVSSGTPDFNYYSFAKQLNSYIAVGLSLKFQRQHPSDYYQFFGYNFSYDIALLSRAVPWIQIGMLAQNLPQKRYINLLSLGFSYRRGNLTLPIDIVLKSAIPEIHLGAEYNLKRRFYLRAGVSDYHPTFGFGVKIWNFRLDYAWIQEGRTNSHFASAELSRI